MMEWQRKISIETEKSVINPLVSPSSFPYSIFYWLSLEMKAFLKLNEDII